jgi:hypothetical protein
MNTPSPPPPLPPGNLVTKTMPTLGSVIGSASGAAIAAAFKISDPLTVATLVTCTTALVTALFHWAGNKFGLPALE